MISNIRLISASLALFENSIIYTFINRMIENSCKCSDDPRRHIIVTMTVFNFVIILVSLLNYKNIPKSYLLFIKLYSLFYFITVLTYAWKLKHSSCKCSKGMDLNFIYYTKVIDISLITLFISLIFLAKFLK